MDDKFPKVLEIDIDEILPNRFQPRIQFDEEEILDLSDSIKEHGVIQPIIVRTIGDKYEIIAGERRYKASVLAGRETVPVIVKNFNDKESAEVALIENIQRKNLTPIEEALSYKKILDMGYLTQESLATKLGKSQSSVANKIRLLNLSDEVQEALLDNKISERHARSLLRLKSMSEQNEMLDKIIENRMTVRKTDEEIDKVLKDKKGEDKMNNEINTIQPTVGNSTNTSFDIFGGSSVAPMPEVTVQQPVMPEIPSMQPITSAPNVGMPFDAPWNPMAPSAPEVPVMPQVEMSVPSPMPEVTIQQPIMPEIPSVQPVEVTPMSPNVGISFDALGNVVSAPEVPVMPQVEIPVTSPIQDVSTQQSVIPEPIIITDYNKQYDPVMPNAMPVINKVDFKEVIAAIRECSQKIEKYGYKIDLEEYDLSTIYQVIFKIEK